MFNITQENCTIQNRIRVPASNVKREINVAHGCVSFERLPPNATQNATHYATSLLFSFNCFWLGQAVRVDLRRPSAVQFLGPYHLPRPLQSRRAVAAFFCTSQRYIILVGGTKMFSKTGPQDNEQGTIIFIPLIVDLLPTTPGLIFVKLPLYI